MNSDDHLTTLRKRKDDHLRLAGDSAVEHDSRFYYEPMLYVHKSSSLSFDFLGKTMNQRLWISSMTGGTSQSGTINRRLAEACSFFGLGMGLGSCRSLLDSFDTLPDFNLRSIIGAKSPFFANIGIAQLEKLCNSKALGKIDDRIINRLDTDGIIIHVNPIQEFIQPEGDKQQRPAIETISRFVEHVNKQYKVVVKEVGQGIGPQSLTNLMSTGIDAIEFAAFGGTNFASIELRRSFENQSLLPLAQVGHTIDEMLDVLNPLQNKFPDTQMIISGGIRNFLDGYYYVNKSVYVSVYGMANTLLQKAMESQKALFNFIETEKKGYEFAESFLKVRT